MEVTINRRGLYIVTILMVAIFAIQFQNLFNFPYYQDAEGTNLSNAISILEGQDLSPYTYTYEEPPAGALLMSLWARVTQPLNLFDFSLESGRVLMLLVHLVSVAMVYGITQKLSKSNIAAIIAVLIFSFSPLAISYQRRILLDNLMLMWVLIAFYLVIGKDRTLTQYFTSAVIFGVAVLTKIAALGLLPAMFLIILTQSHKHHRRFATYQWLLIAVLMISFFPLYAQMRQELFPQGTLLGGDFPHVSLLEQFADRNALEFGIGLTNSFDSWVDLSNLNADPVIIYVGLIATIFVFLLSIENRMYRSAILMTVSYMFYLMFIQRIYTSDIVVLLPFLAINIGIVIGTLMHLIDENLSNFMVKGLAGIFIFGIILYPFYVTYMNRTAVYTVDQVSGQLQAIEWIQENVDDDAVIVVDNYAFVELRQDFPLTHHYWRVDTDPEIKFTLLDDNHCNIDYIISTNQVMTDIDGFKLELVRRAVEDSEILFSYENNGWPVELRQVQKDNCPIEDNI